jgi:translation initiation factor IF-2
MNVSKGQLAKKFKYRILRAGKVLKDGLSLSSLKFHKDEVNEIKKGQDCGLAFFEYEDFKEGDTVEGYEVKLVEEKAQ